LKTLKGFAKKELSKILKKSEKKIVELKSHLTEGN
jgi:hypothetical protein